MEGYNIIGCDALNIGNKDFAEGTDFLKELASNALFPFVSANIVDAEKKELLFEPFRVIERSGLRLGVLGLTTHLPAHVDDVVLLDPIDQARKILADLEGQTDYQVVLFSGSYQEALAASDSLVSADFIFVSGTTRTPARRRSERVSGPRIYRLGKQGKSLGIVHFDIEDANQELIDVSTLKWREAFITRQLKRMGQKDPSKELEEIYQDSPEMVDRIHQITVEKKSIEKRLAELKSTLWFDFVPMTKEVEDNPQLLAMVEKTLAECDRIEVADKTSNSSPGRDATRATRGSPRPRVRTSIQ
ncbi:MAG: hypothetical protein V3U24_05350 [Candidatus Neomarinimicrobiota bacterium]